MSECYPLKCYTSIVLFLDIINSEQRVDAPGGTGKTFLIETLAAWCALPENNFLCLCSAFSGVAAQLLPNGVTIHRRFNMKPGMDPETNCNIDRGSSKAQLLQEAKLIVMDEVTMMSKVDLERIDRTLRYLMNNVKSNHILKINFSGK